MICKKDLRYIPNEKPFRLAAMNCHYIKFPLEYFLDSVAGYGFKYIELFGAMPHFFLDDVDDRLVDEVIRECRKRFLSICSFCPAQGAYPMNIAIDELQIRKRTLRMLKKALNIAGKMGCETMLVSPGFGYHNQDKSVSWNHSVDSLKELSEIAEDNGVIILLEPLTPTTANLVNTSMEAKKMIRQVGTGFVKSMMDIGVMNYMGETVDEYFMNLGEDLRYIHFTDGPGAHVALGDGNFPMDKYLDDIERNGYKGVLSFEINDKKYLLDPNRAMETNIRWMKTYGLSG